MAMGSSRLLFFSALNLALTFSCAQLLRPRGSDDRGKFTANTTYEANLNNLLFSFTSIPANDYGCYNMSIGQNSDRVNAIALWGGDINPDVRYDGCILRYSNRSILGAKQTSDSDYLANGMDVTNPTSFNERLNNLLLLLIPKAASGGSLRKFATGNNESDHFQPIYALAQCTPDLSQDDCIACLEESSQRFPQCCFGKLGGRVITSSCVLHFEMVRFYNASPDALPPSPSPPPPSNETTNSTAMDEDIVSTESLQFDFGTIRIATNNFSEENKLGQGGSGAVYKLSSGQDIAVNRLSRESGQGDLEFKNEVLLVAKLQHRNLVRLLGFRLQRTERLLAYEFVPNANLDRFIFHY